MKKVLITGCSRGLGLAMAKRFSLESWQVAGCSRRNDDLDPLRKEMGSPHIFRSADVADEQSVYRFSQVILEEMGTPDLLLNNAAIINQNAPLWKVPSDEFSQLIDINIKGVANIVRHIVPSMIEAGSGVVVNFSSYWGRSTSSEVAPYCASKWAIEGLSQALAQELPHGMAAVALNPGIINTSMLQTCFGSSAASYPKAEEWANLAVPFLSGLGPKNNGESLTVPS